MNQFPFPKIFVVVMLLVLFIGQPLMIIGIHDLVFSPERKDEFFVVTDGNGNYRIGDILPNGRLWISTNLSFIDSSEAKEVVDRWNAEDVREDSLKNVKWIRLNK